MYYIYKIENIQNGRIYIGLTNNLGRRRARHFTDLKCHRHDNAFLQKEYDIYGPDSFIFDKVFEGDVTSQEISDLEKFYIQKYDSYRNGYNQNTGGNFGPSNGGSQLTWSDIFIILAVGDFSSRSGSLMRRQFDISNTTVSRIRKGVNHVEAYEAYHRLSTLDKKKIYDIYNESFNLEEQLHLSHSLKTKRKLNEQQIYYFLASREFKKTPKERIAKEFKVATNTLTTIEKGISYQDVVDKYKKMTPAQRKMCL